MRWRHVCGVKGERPIELRHFSSVVWRHRWIIVMTALAATAVALGLSLLSAAEYEARSTLRLTTPTSLSSGNVRADDLDYTDRLENTYAELLESRPARQEVGERLELGYTPDVRVEARPGTELFDVVGRASTRAEAVAIADAASVVLLARVAELGAGDIATSDALFEQRIGELEAQLAEDRGRRRELIGKKNPELVKERRELLGTIRTAEAALIAQRAQFERERLARGARTGTLTIVAPAQRPSDEAGPSPVLIAVAGGLIGLVAAIGLAFVLENLRPRRNSAREIEDLLDVPILGRIPAEEASEATAPIGPDARDDAFRQLRTRLLANLEGRGKGAILLTGTGDAVRHVRVANNLARSLAEGGRSVVLVDGNVRKAVYEDDTDTATEPPGLVDALERRQLPIDIVQNGVVDGVSLLPTGQRSENAAELLSSAAMREVLASLRERFDVVLVVGPSLDGTPDALALASAAGAAIVVVESADVDLDVVRDARHQLRQVRARVLGLVVQGHDSITPPHTPPGGPGVEYA